MSINIATYDSYFIPKTLITNGNISTIATDTS